MACRTLLSTGLLVGLTALSGGCHSILNGWLDPTVLGSFDGTGTTEIRSSLTLEDTPPGIPGAMYPTLEDQRIKVVEFPISAGDSVEIEINELRQRQAPYQAQAQVSATGYVNIPILGRIQAAGMTVPEFEEKLVESLRDRNVLIDPEVTVNPLFLQKATYSIFGVGVSAANNAPLRAGTFPIRRPDLRLLEAINQVGGLNEFVTEVYIFRYDEAPSVEPEARPGNGTEGQAQPPSNGNNHVGNGRGHAPRTAAEHQATSPAKAAPQDLFDALERSEEPPESPKPTPSEAREILDTVEADPAQQFIYVNGAFVPNPAYRKPSPAAEPNRVEPPSAEMVSPAVNWARLAGESNFRILQVSAASLRSGDPSTNIYVRAGDVIRIVSGEIGVFYVMGQVNRVGAFAFNAEPITLKTAIVNAGGLAGLAWPDRCTVYRRLGQREQMIQVNLDRIFAGAEPDFMIKRGDIINVGTHPFAPFLQRIRALSLPNIANNVGYSFTYARNFADIDSFAVRQNPHNRPDRFPNLFP